MPVFCVFPLYVNFVFDPVNVILAFFFSVSSIEIVESATTLRVVYFVPSAVKTLPSCFTLLTVNPLFGFTKNEKLVPVSTVLSLPSRAM